MKKVLVTGPTGYVGGRLIPLLLKEGYDVRVLSRKASRLRDYPWFNDVEIVEGDARDVEAVKKSVESVDLIYYLLHAIVTGDDFDETEKLIAKNFGKAALDANVKQIIYLGGIANKPKNELSKHLASRIATGEILRASGVPTIELRAAVIIGSGSASFEMLRYLTERLPIMVTPKWLSTRIQPIAIRDVLRYLVECSKLKKPMNKHFDIGGRDVLTYEEMMQRYARVAELRKRMIVTLPVLTPSLSSHWINFVTPVPRSIARPLVSSLTTEVVVQGDDINQFLGIEPKELLDFETAVSLALEKVRNADVETRWSSALSKDQDQRLPSDPLPTDPKWSGGSLYVDKREKRFDGSLDKLWKVIESIGGKNGWYSFPLAWQVRGFIDRIFGGVGMRRGRRDDNKLRLGETVDFWRVLNKVDGEELELLAEMKLPGTAVLKLSIEKRRDHNFFVLIATFRPKGLLGHLYWWVVRPFHGIVFGSMVKNIVKKAS